MGTPYRNTPLKCGALDAFLAAPVPCLLGNAEVVNLQSGRFVIDDGSSRAEIAADGDTLLMGWIEAKEGAITAANNDSEGKYTVGLYPISSILGVRFLIPVNSGTYAVTMKNNTCDLSVSSGIQGAQLDASAEDTLIVVDGDLVNNNYVIVTVNPDKITGLTGVA